MNEYYKYNNEKKKLSVGYTAWILFLLTKFVLGHVHTNV